LQGRTFDANRCKLRCKKTGLQVRASVFKETRIATKKAGRNGPTLNEDYLAKLSGSERAVAKRKEGQLFEKKVIRRDLGEKVPSVSKTQLKKGILAKKKNKIPKNGGSGNKNQREDRP